MEGGSCVTKMVLNMKVSGAMTSDMEMAFSGGPRARGMRDSSLGGLWEANLQELTSLPTERNAKPRGYLRLPPILLVEVVDTSELFPECLRHTP